MIQKIPPFTMEAFEKMAREFYPEETKQMYFVDTSDPAHKSRIIDFVNGIAPEKRDFFFKHRGGAEGYADSLIAMKNAGEYKGDKASGLKMILIDVADQRRKIAQYPWVNADAVLWETAFHELGHGVVPGAGGDMAMDITENSPPTETEYASDVTGDAPALITHRMHYKENSADGFSALWRVKLGLATPEEIKEAALERAFYSVWFGRAMGYATFQTLNQIAVDAKTANFISLSPQELKGIAEKHAEHFHKSPEEIKSAFGKIDTIQLKGGEEAPRIGTPEFMTALEGLRKNLDAPTDSLEFNASAIIINRALEVKATRKQMNTPEWKEAKKKLVEKSEGLGQKSILASFQAAAKRRNNPILATIDFANRIDREVTRRARNILHKIGIDL